jgi:hypothetical protein
MAVVYLLTGEEHGDYSCVPYATAESAMRDNPVPAEIDPNYIAWTGAGWVELKPGEWTNGLRHHLGLLITRTEVKD